jgi:hypothetical protein
LLLFFSFLEQDRKQAAPTCDNIHEAEHVAAIGISVMPHAMQLWPFDTEDAPGLLIGSDVDLNFGWNWCYWV